jgi:hypothetical protein
MEDRLDVSADRERWHGGGLSRVRQAWRSWLLEACAWFAPEFQAPRTATATSAWRSERLRPFSNSPCSELRLAIENAISSSDAPAVSGARSKKTKANAILQPARTKKTCVITSVGARGVTRFSDPATSPAAPDRASCQDRHAMLANGLASCATTISSVGVNWSRFNSGFGTSVRRLVARKGPAAIPPPFGRSQCPLPGVWRAHGRPARSARGFRLHLRPAASP